MIVGNSVQLKLLKRVEFHPNTSIVYNFDRIDQTQLADHTGIGRIEFVEINKGLIKLIEATDLNIVAAIELDLIQTHTIDAIVNLQYINARGLIAYGELISDRKDYVILHEEYFIRLVI